MPAETTTPTAPPSAADRRHRRPPRHRVLLVGVAVLGVALAGMLARTLFSESQGEAVVEDFGAAWVDRDYGAMYALLNGPSREELARDAFEDAYADAAATATTVDLSVGDASEDDGEIVLPITATTNAFGTVGGDLRMRVRSGGLAWAPHHAFPGLERGEELSRETRAPERGELLARDGTVLAMGSASERSSELGIDASSAAGTIGPPATAEERDALAALGFPDDTLVGLTGLERVFDDRLLGTPGGELRAGERTLAVSEPRPAPPITTTIDPDLQRAAVTALGGLGGVAAVDARSGAVRALAGIAATGPQPPGSTFKIITTTAALEAGVVEPETDFPVETAATIDGVTLRNAHGAPCGGSFANSFAESCNSVFAPLGIEVGAERLVETAERYGLNSAPALPGAAPSTIPAAEEFESDLELGATAIGQGKVLMTVLRLAAVTQAIAADGRLSQPTLEPAAAPQRSRVTSPAVADTIEELMVGVVAGGTGSAAAISGVDVAGKTGTAELGEGITEHAWFTAFAPAGSTPELAIAVMVANGGAGGEVAAPVARTILEAGL